MPLTHPASIVMFMVEEAKMRGMNVANDILTTIRNPQVQHLPFSRIPVRGGRNEWARGNILDSPQMSCGANLEFCSNIPAGHYISSFPLESLLCHPEGTVLLGYNGELVGARCSSSLSANISVELYNIYRQMEMYWPFLLQGADVANVCVNFVVTGMKQDNNTKLK
jgi:hypothetical protein